MGLDWDVIVVGAGISGIGASYHLAKHCPDRSFTVLEGRDRLGGTWDLFRYPGVRSDSDMHTLGYGFKPWAHERSIADGPSILAYLEETVEEFDLGKYLQFGHHIEHANWSSHDSAWTLDVRVDGVVKQIRCGLLYVCAGYYKYEHGHTPEFAGRDDFSGTIVHPQLWPDDLDVAEQKVVVIGSGATAVTLVPELSKSAQHVTMLQRSPTYMAARSQVDESANKLRELLPETAAYKVTRTKNVTSQQVLYAMTRRSPERIREKLLSHVRAAVGDDMANAHFSPTYNPWDQRLCLVPNGDLFAAINAGDATVVTAEIDRFTENGIALSTGEHLDADIIVTATGLELNTLGGIAVSVDDERVDFGETWTYRGVGYSGVPNLFSTFGYINASWTLRSDMINAFVCRVLNHMGSIGASACTPRLRPSDSAMVARPWIDDFSSGYVQRARDILPQQGDREPWRNHQTYVSDRRSLLHSPMDDGVLRFTRRLKPSG